MTDPTPIQVADALEDCCPCRAVGEVCQHHVACNYQAHGARVIRTLAARVAELEAENERLGREVNRWRYGDPDFAWSVHTQAMGKLSAENKRLREGLTRITWVLDEDHGAMAAQAYRYARAALKEEDDELATD